LCDPFNYIQDSLILKSYNLKELCNLN